MADAPRSCSGSSAHRWPHFMGVALKSWRLAGSDGATPTLDPSSTRCDHSASSDVGDVVLAALRAPARSMSSTSVQPVISKTPNGAMPGTESYGTAPDVQTLACRHALELQRLPAANRESGVRVQAWTPMMAWTRRRTTGGCSPATPPGNPPTPPAVLPPHPRTRVFDFLKGGRFGPGGGSRFSAHPCYESGQLDERHSVLPRQGWQWPGACWKVDGGRRG